MDSTNQQDQSATRKPKPEYDKWYHRAHWYRLRGMVLARDPICMMCHRNPATIADHIIPHKGIWELFSDLLNLQGLCKGCHDIKTSREDGGYGRAPAVAQRTETPKPVPTGEKGGSEFQSSTISTKKLDSALEMADDFLDGL